MKFSTITIAAFLGIAGTTCGVNAGAMTALTNAMSRLQAQERRRHLEDAGSPCEEEDTALEACAAANPDVCGLDDEDLRKLGRESRSGRSYSLSNGHHGRHLDELDDEPSCESFEFNACFLSAILPSCPCLDELNASTRCEAEANGLDCTTPTQETCDAYDCFFECYEATPCFDSVGYCSYDEESKLWSGNYEECNVGAATCAECFPDAQCDETCAACAAAAPCFDGTGYCSFDKESKLWSGSYEECNAPGAALCEECFPDAQCDDPCASCALAAPCFDGSGYCSYDKENALWSGDYEGCNAGAAACEACFPEAQCDLDGLCAQCAIAGPCFDNVGHCSYDEESKLWSGDYEECNGGAALCLECFPEAQCDDTCAICAIAAPCFDGIGCCSYDEESALWSGEYEGCNAGAATCAVCFPDPQCDPDGNDACAPCVEAAQCFNSTGCCSYDEESKLWSGDYEECNGGAVACAECFPDAQCTVDSITAVPSTSPSTAPSSSPSEPSAGVTSVKSLGTFMIVTVVSACVLFM